MSVTEITAIPSSALTSMRMGQSDGEYLMALETRLLTTCLTLRPSEDLGHRSRGTTSAGSFAGDYPDAVSWRAFLFSKR
jgi:hypothetical protein